MSIEGDPDPDAPDRDAERPRDAEEKQVPLPDSGILATIAEATPDVVSRLLVVGATAAAAAIDPSLLVPAAATSAVVMPILLRIGARLAATERQASAEKRLDADRLDAHDAKLDVLDVAGVEHAERINEVDRAVDELAGVVTRAMREERLTPVVKELARLAAAGAFGADGEAPPQHLADGLYRAFRDAADAIDPRTGPAFGRLASLYAHVRMDRPGRNLGEFLVHLEHDDWNALQTLAPVLDGALSEATELGAKPQFLNIFRQASTVNLNDAPTVRLNVQSLGGPYPTVRDLDPAVAGLIPLLTRYGVAAAGDTGGDSAHFLPQMVRRFVWVMTGRGAAS